MEEQPIPEEAIQSEYKIIPIVEKRELFKRRGLELVQASEDVNTIFFLDKSARPLAYFYRKLFTVINPTKPLPKIRFLNIGHEKTRIFQTDSKTKIDTNSLIQSIQTRTDLDKHFGTDNIDQLIKILNISRTPTKRLVVDDLVFSGGTQKLTKKILDVVDPVNSYPFFIFIDSPEDKLLMFPNGKSHYAFLPWQGDPGIVEDEVGNDDKYNFDPSFTTRSTTQSEKESIPDTFGFMGMSKYEFSLQIRNELIMLADEVVINK